MSTFKITLADNDGRKVADFELEDYADLDELRLIIKGAREYVALADKTTWLEFYDEGEKIVESFGFNVDGGLENAHLKKAELEKIVAMQEALDGCHLDIQALDAWFDNGSCGACDDLEDEISTAEEMYNGTYDNAAAFAQSMFEEMQEALPSWVQNHVDWEGVADSELIHDYNFLAQDNGMIAVFRA